MKRPAPKAPKAAPTTRLCPDVSKDDRLRRWAAKIMSELPSGMADSLMVLKYAERLVYWAAIDDSPIEPKMGRRSGR